MEVYTVPFGNAEALVKKKLENCIILSSYILLDHYTPHFFVLNAVFVKLVFYKKSYIICKLILLVLMLVPAPIIVKLANI